ncbi:hypothetical protein ME9_01486, partial [Bartonella taylorii 8TBB]
MDIIHKLIKLFLPLIMGIWVGMLCYRFNSYSWKHAAKEALPI